MQSASATDKSWVALRARTASQERCTPPCTRRVLRQDARNQSALPPLPRQEGKKLNLQPLFCTHHCFTYWCLSCWQLSVCKKNILHLKSSIFSLSPVFFLLMFVSNIKNHFKIILWFKFDIRVTSLLSSSRNTAVILVNLIRVTLFFIEDIYLK